MSAPLMSLAEWVKLLVFNSSPVPTASAITTLKGLSGRSPGGVNERLASWLRSDSGVLPEPINVTHTDSINDLGVDVLLEGVSSKSRIGFQIKTDNDLADKNFSKSTKAQITDAKGWHLDLYVILFACTPSPEQAKRIQMLFNDICSTPDPWLVAVNPCQAAALVASFVTPLPQISSTSPTWSKFFTEAGVGNLAPLYLERWDGLTPFDRYCATNVFQKLSSSISKNPVTFLIGPPGVGKTFLSMLALWDAYVQNRNIRWIASDGGEPVLDPFDDGQVRPFFNTKVEQLTRKLGIEKSRAPTDSIDFIAANFKAGSLVYIEDPFGKTDREFHRSLQAYDFFNLDDVIEAIRQRSTRTKTRVLITSREGLFEKWISEKSSKGTFVSEDSIVRISSQDYRMEDRENHAQRLLRNLKGSDEIVSALLQNSESPFELELLLDEVRPEVTVQAINEKGQERRKHWKNKLAPLIKADTDGERLFLFLVDALRTRGIGRNHFSKLYSKFFELAQIEGDSNLCLSKALIRYNPFVTRIMLMRLSEKNPLSKMNPPENHFHLEPVHSTIVESVHNLLLDSGTSFLENLAKSLSTEKSESDIYPLSNVCIALLRLRIGNTPGAAQDGIVHGLFGSNDSSTLRLIGVMDVWDRVNTVIKGKFFEKLEQPACESLATDVACSLLNSKFEADECWHVLRILVKRGRLATRGNFSIFRNPWEYLFANIDAAPSDIVDFVTKIAANRPDVFGYAVGSLVVRYWDRAPEKWKASIFSSTCRDSDDAQNNILLQIAMTWQKAPQQIKEYFTSQIESPIDEVRAAVGAVALVSYESAPETFGPIVQKLAFDSNSLVPIKIFSEGAGEDPHDFEFAKNVFSRMAGFEELLFLSLLLESKASWAKELADQCKNRTGLHGEAVALSHKLRLTPDGQAQSKNLISKSSSGEKAANLWLVPSLNPEKVTERLPFSDDPVALLQSIDGVYRTMVLSYFSYQYNFLPSNVREFIDQLERSSGSDHEAILAGKKRRQPPGNSHSLGSFANYLYSALTS